MPYIKPEERNKWEEALNHIAFQIESIKQDHKETQQTQLDGELNYLITHILIMAYSKKYFDCNRAVGMLECCKQEFYRKFIGPYEDHKAIENGDVYPKE